MAAVTRALKRMAVIATRAATSTSFYYPAEEDTGKGVIITPLERRYTDAHLPFLSH